MNNAKTIPAGTHPAFVFGHYDSRGGAVIMFGAAGATQAKAEYCKWIGWEDERQWAGDSVEAWVDEDFIGAAVIESYRALRDGEDLEYTEPGTAEKLWVNHDNEFDNVFDAKAPLVFKLTAGDQPEGFFESQYGEDAYGLVVVIVE